MIKQSNTKGVAYNNWMHLEINILGIQLIQLDWVTLCDCSHKSLNKYCLEEKDIEIQLSKFYLCQNHNIKELCLKNDMLGSQIGASMYIQSNNM